MVGIQAPTVPVLWHHGSGQLPKPENWGHLHGCLSCTLQPAGHSAHVVFTIVPTRVSCVRVQTVLFVSTPLLSYTRPWYMAGVTKLLLKN